MCCDLATHESPAERFGGESGVRVDEFGLPGAIRGVALGVAIVRFHIPDLKKNFRVSLNPEGPAWLKETKTTEKAQIR